MIRKSIYLLGAALALGVQPVAAQDSSDEAAMAAMAEAFKAEPLNAEQQASLPAAEAVVARIFPPGTYMKMMDGTMKPMMDGIMGQVSQIPVADLVRLTGMPEEDIAGMGEGTLAEVMEILDPAYAERQRLMTDTMFEWMTRLMNEMEPSFRAGLARAYAVRFEESELTELARFFATPVGSHYAEESMLIMMDPQVMSTMSEMMPKMFEMMPQMTQAMQDKAAGLPEPRSVEDLSEDERAKLAELLGTTGE